MRNLKRVLSLALACVMVIGMMVMTTGAADIVDIDEVTNTEAVEVMAALGVLEGDENGVFNPNGILTREQAAKIICYMLVGPANAEMLVGTSNFTDVAADRWSAPYISYCSSLGIISGYAGEFNPTGELTGVAFAKMLLVALGYDAEIEGYVNNDNWATNIGSDAIEVGLNVKGAALDAAVTRENAAQMAFQALDATMVYYDGGMNVTVSDGTTVTVGATRYTKAQGIFPDNTGVDGLQFCERYFEDLKKDDTTKIADKYGRPGYTWEIDNDSKNDIFVVDEPLVVYTKDMNTAAGKKVVAANLKGYTVTGTSIEDGTTGTAFADTDDVAALTSDTETVEIYVNKDTKTVTAIVEIGTYADTVATVTEADEENDVKASITLTNATGLNTIETDAFAKDDVVLYTKVWDGTSAYDVVTIEKADAITGTLTSYTKDNKYTIGGNVYEVSGISGVLTNDTTVPSYIGVEKVYHLDANGDIVAVTAVPGAAPVVIKDYLVVMDSNLKVTADDWAGTKSVSAQVKVVLSDGTSGTYDLPLTKLDADKDTLEKGDYVLYIGNTPNEIVDKDATTATDGQTALDTLLGCTTPDQPTKVFTYTLNGTELKLAAALGTFDGTETNNGAKLATNDADAIDEDSIAISANSKTVIANESTVFVLKTATGYTVKTGIAALAGVTQDIPQDEALIVANVIAGKDADGNADASKNVNVATVVFAVETTYTGVSAVDTTDLIYVDGTYTVTEDTDKTLVYTYEVVKADGTKIAAEGSADLAEGIYVLKTDGTIGTKDTATEVTVGVIAGTTYELGASTYKTVTEDTVVIVVAKDASLVTGAKVFYYDDLGDGVIDLIFVSEKAAD